MSRLLVFIILFLMAAASAAQAKIVTRTVPYQHEGTQLQGHLAYDDALEGKRPGVLVVHEWWGLNGYARRRADQLAEMGYVAFALDMYGEGKATRHPEQAAEWSKEIRDNLDRWQQRALAGLEILKKDPRTDAGRLAAIGYCFGGATVQVLAYSGADLDGVVGFHGSLIPPTAEQASRVQSGILICHGAADPLVKPEAMQNYIAAMEEFGLDWQMIIYGGAKHSFTNPGADQAGMDPLAYSESADKRSWAHMKMFFDHIF